MKTYYAILKILKESTLSVPENWDIYEVGPKTPNRNQSGNKYFWVFYEGGNDWETSFKYQAVYVQAKHDHQGEMSRIWIEIKYPSELSDKKNGGGVSLEIQKLQKEFGKQIADKWISLAKKLRAKHASEKYEWHRIADEENKKMHDADKKGIKYERNLPDIPKYDGNWVDAFIVALKSKDIFLNIRRFGIDRTNWKESNDIKNFEDSTNE